MLHVISLAQYAIVYTRSWAVNSLNGRVRLKAENDRLRQEFELLQEEIRIKDAPHSTDQSASASPLAAHGHPGNARQHLANRGE